MNKFDQLSPFEQWLWVKLVAVTKCTNSQAIALTVSMDDMRELAIEIASYGNGCYESGYHDFKMKAVDDLHNGISNAIRAYLESDEL